MLLVYSSFVLLGTFMYGIYVVHWLGPAFFLMTALSITNHYHLYKYQEKGILWKIDTYYAHSLLVVTMIEACTRRLCIPMYIYWICNAWIVYVYKIKNLSNQPRTGDYWHSTIHFSGVIGTCALLYTIQKQI